MRRLILLISVDWVPPSLPPSGACLSLGSSVLYQPLNAAEGYTTPGLRLFRCTLEIFSVLRLVALGLLALRYDGDLFGNSPHKSRELPGNGYRNDVGVFASGDESSVPFAQPDLGFPTAGLDEFGLFFQPQLQMSTDFRWVAIGPGAFHQDPAGMSVPGFGDRPLPASLGTGVFRGNQAQELHQLSWVLKTRQVTNFGHYGDGHGKWHPTQGLQGLDHGVQTPRFHLFLEFLFQTLETLGVLTDSPDIFLKDDLVRRGLTDDFREPSEMGRTPIGPASVPDIVSQQEGFEPEFGGLEIAEGIFARPREVPNGFIFDLGHIDRSEVPRAGQAGQLHGVAAVGFDPITGLFWNQRRCHHPAVGAFFPQIPVEPVTTRAGFIDKDEMFGLGLHFADKLINVTLAGANGAEEGDLGAVVLHHIRYGNRLFVDIHTDEECARLGHG